MRLWAGPALVGSTLDYGSPKTAQFLRSTTLWVWASLRWAYRFTMARVLWPSAKKTSYENGPFYHAVISSPAPCNLQSPGVPTGSRNTKSPDLQDRYRQGDPDTRLLCLPQCVKALDI